MAYEHLGLIRWPFPVVPSRLFCDFIADRKTLAQDIEVLLRALSRQDASSIHLLWSWFGAGKTHTLYYIANRAAQLSKLSGNHFHSIYSEFPKSPRSFLDVYRAFAVGLDSEELIDAYLEISTTAESQRLQREMAMTSPDLVNALLVAATGKPHEHTIAIRWLRGESLPMSEFRRVGISQKIDSSEAAGRILSALIQLLALAAKSQGRPGCRVLWMIDEFQRIEKLPSRVRDDINTGLHSTFNACPSGLSLILSFSGRPKDTLPAWFTEELRDRIGRTKVLVLPPMLSDNALGFVRDILKHLRTLEAYSGSPYFPFTEETCRFIIQDIESQQELKPRSVMHAFNAVLQEADSLIDAKELTVITPEFAKRVLAEHVPLKEIEEE